MYNYKKLLLSNKLKVLLIPDKKFKLVVFEINMLIGNDVETKELLEIGHFIEHLFSLYTSTKYPCGSKNRDVFYFKNIDIDAEIVNKNIKFKLEFEPKHTDFVIDILTNALLDFKIDNEMFIKEKNAVIEELNEIIKDDEYKFHKKISSIIYKNCQRRFSQDDRLANTKKIKPDQIISYFKNYFKSGNMIFTIFGNISSKQKKELLSRLSQIPKGKYKYKINSLNFNTKIIHLRKNTNICQLKLLFKTSYILFSKEAYHLEAVDDILTNDLNSILLKELRTNKGLIYNITGEFELDEVSKNLSLYELTSVVDCNNIYKLLESILLIFTKLKQCKLDNKYFVNLRNKNKIEYLKKTYILEPENVISNYSKEYLWSQPITKLKQRIDIENELNADLFKKYCNKIFTKDNLVVCYESNKNIDKQIKILLNNFK